MSIPPNDTWHIVLPDKAQVFRRRAMRFEVLLTHRPDWAYLAFAEQIASAQQHSMTDHPSPRLPDERLLRLRNAHAVPPLCAHSGRQENGWHEALAVIGSRVSHATTGKTRTAIERLLDTPGAQIESFARGVLCGYYGGVDSEARVLLAAALQVHWVAMAAEAAARAAFGPTEVPSLCPVCGSPPVATVLRRHGGTLDRYLHCSLCATEWSMAVDRCTSCGSRGWLHYFRAGGAHSAVRAEACDECGSYLKILNLDHAPTLDPTADDLFTLELDAAAQDAGFARSGPNLLFVPGIEPSV
ncbi:MAG: formate dehydrogenase accessory protein FdhE [Betaproteobacteria bacterium]|nr:formate dehydrogenase accessory protein FdhE [Betaproteobacteria bacterium]